MAFALGRLTCTESLPLELQLVLASKKNSAPIDVHHAGPREDHPEIARSQFSVAKFHSRMRVPANSTVFLRQFQ
jgi:hypothetical protein